VRVRNIKGLPLEDNREGKMTVKRAVLVPELKGDEI